MKKFGKARLRISLPFFSYEIQLDDLLSSKDIDQRVKKLIDIEKDLEDAIDAVKKLQHDALKSKHEVKQLDETINKLKQDKDTAESMLKFPQESFTRVLTRASSKGRTRGITEGIIIGFITGVLSSFVVRFFAK